MRKFNVAVVGATGAVGEEFYRLFEEYNFPIAKLVPLASARSVGKEVEYNGRSIKVKELTHTVFEEEEVDIAFFSAGGSVSAEFADSAVEAGAVVIDNTSHFRMDPDIPLVVPEVNPEDIALWKNRGIIANPNCSTIQMVQALKAVDDLYGIVRVDVSTYQATSGAGKAGMEELIKQMQDFFAFKLDESAHEAFLHQIALNVIPQIDVAMENGFTKEEMKTVLETQKIMGDDSIKISPTTVRVPVPVGHGESIKIETEDRLSPDEAREIVANFPGLVVLDDPNPDNPRNDPFERTYPTAQDIRKPEYRDAVMVGRTGVLKP